MKKAVIFASLVAAAALSWRIFAGKEVLSAEYLQTLLGEAGGFRDSRWVLPAIVVTYIVALFAMFPLTILVVVTGLLFGPLWGFLYAIVATLASSVFSFWLGRSMGADAVRHLAGRRVRRISAYLKNRGLWTMVFVSLVPVAPFSFINMIAGAFRMRFSSYILGSTIGLIPSVAIAILVGSHVGFVFVSLGTDSILLVSVIATILVALCVVTALWARSRLRGPRIVATVAQPQPKKAA